MEIGSDCQDKKKNAFFTIQFYAFIRHNKCGNAKKRWGGMLYVNKEFQSTMILDSFLPFATYISFLHLWSIEEESGVCIMKVSMPNVASNDSI